MKHTATIFIAIMLATSALADDGKPPSPGLSFFANAGGFWADNVTADFYNGCPQNANTIDRVLHSQSYGEQIWQSLTNQQLISPSVIGHYSQLQVEEYARMRYRISYQIGLGIRYDYAFGFGWLLRFDMTKLNAIGAFNLSSDNGAGILGSDRYIRCGIYGKEERISIDFAITKTVPLNEILSLEIDLGASLINTKVHENQMEIGGGTYSILDIWEGRSPDYNMAGYEYINQGGIGYGVFMSAWVGYSIPDVGAIRAGYTCYQTKTELEGYSAWGWQHMIGVRIEMNNFSFIQ